jgi:hypothetical protein
VKCGGLSRCFSAQNKTVFLKINEAGALQR